MFRKNHFQKQKNNVKIDHYKIHLHKHTSKNIHTNLFTIFVFWNNVHFDSCLYKILFIFCFWTVLHKFEFKIWHVYPKFWPFLAKTWWVPAKFLHFVQNFDVCCKIWCVDDFCTLTCCWFPMFVWNFDIFDVCMLLNCVFGDFDVLVLNFDIFAVTTLLILFLFLMCCWYILFLMCHLWFWCVIFFWCDIFAFEVCFCLSQKLGDILLLRYVFIFFSCDILVLRYVILFWCVIFFWCKIVHDLIFDIIFAFDVLLKYC